MKVVSSLAELRSARAALHGPLGLIPTMGYLHAGHLSLVQRARIECASVAVSIFVNPTQFAPAEDLASYPRDLDRDLAMLKRVGTDLVWTPVAEEMYPSGYQTWVTVERLTLPLEGAWRPGHFRGVATIVAKLFNAMQPQRAYFGQKDAQQALVIRQMVRDLNFPLEVVVGQIIREPDGLAMSSRNSYLAPDQRRAATVLHRALKAAEHAFAAGDHDAESLRRIMMDILLTEPLAVSEYVSVAEPDTLSEIDGEVRRALLSMAVKVGKTRLIDNLELG
jgi:pantoate--beta-alanine ligase